MWELETIRWGNKQSLYGGREKLREGKRECVYEGKIGRDRKWEGQRERVVEKEVSVWYLGRKRENIIWRG